MVEPRYNLVEPAPKGTGKSFVFDNMSRYVGVRSGSISPAVLFFNVSRKTAGLITRYDCVVIDEAQKVKADSAGELTALLKSYLESGRFGRGSANSISAEAGIALLANIEIDENRNPINEEIGLFRSFPNFLRETAFIDRFSGLLPGWYLPRINKKTPSNNIGLKGDIFGEILHALRGNISYKDYVKTNMELVDCDDMRDTKAIESGVSGLLKILFPNKNPTEDEFYMYCVNPAVELRQRIRDELCKLDREYIPVTLKSKYPNKFQKAHRLPVFYNVDENGKIIQSIYKKDLESNSDYTEDPLNVNRIPRKTIIQIEEGMTGYSYQNLFFPYLQGAKNVKIIDPYIRLEFQIKNFIAFCDILDPKDDTINVHLVTSSDDQIQRDEQVKKLENLKENISQYGITLTYEFDNAIHDRYIQTDSGWNIRLGRGLDIFQKPESWYALGEYDQKKRKCRQTEIDYRRLNK
jgi:ATP-dependent Lon protease